LSKEFERDDNPVSQSIALAVALNLASTAEALMSAATDLEQQIARDCARPGESEVVFDRKGKVGGSYTDSSGVSGLPLDGV
jgi:hypothetical protein